MKIGILTLPLRDNYGGILQAYALQSVLKSLGHDPWIVRFAHDRIPFNSRLKSWVKARINSVLGKPSHRLYSDKQMDTIIYGKLIEFIQEKIQPATGFVKDINALSVLDTHELFDAYVVGSDQVWREKYAKKYLPAYFCTFTERNVLRISYAASFGNSTWDINSDRHSKIKKALRKFQTITVREDSGVKLCSDLFGVHAMQVLDPTLLLGKNKYLALCSNLRNSCNKKGVFEYFLDKTQFKNEVSVKVREAINAESFSLDLPDALNEVPIEKLIKKPVEEWIYCFERADYVVTDSFHGCVFSIIFNKPFLVVGNEERGIDRFRSLLESFGLNDCLIGEDNGRDVILPYINWADVNVRLENFKNLSLRALRDAL